MTKNDLYNNRPHYPYTYGDEVKDDKKRLSDYVVDKFRNKQFTRYLGSVLIAIIALGSQAAPMNAIPPEYGEAAAEATKGTAQQAANFGNGQVSGTQPLPNNFNAASNGNIPQAQQTNINPFHNVPVNTPFGSNNLNGNAKNINEWKNKNEQLGLFIPSPPKTDIGRKINTVGLVVSGFWICLNGAWGNPMFYGGCAGMLLALIGKNIF